MLGVFEIKCAQYFKPVTIIRIIFQPQVAQAPAAGSYYFLIFFYFYANVQRNVTYTADIRYYIMTEFEYTKHDSRLAAYGGFMLQQFEFIKVSMAKNGNRHS